MDSTSVIGVLGTLGLALGSSWASGINLYAMVATLGLLGRFAGLDLPGDLGVVTDWWVIGIAATLYLIEFVADKVPIVDSVWDVVHTFVRVPAGAIVAASAASAGIQVVFDRCITCGFIRNGTAGIIRERGTAKIGVDDDAGRVDHTPDARAAVSPPRGGEPFGRYL